MLWGWWWWGRVALIVHNFQNPESFKFSWRRNSRHPKPKMFSCTHGRWIKASAKCQASCTWTVSLSSSCSQSEPLLGVWSLCRPLTFGATGVGGVDDVAGQTDMQGASEAAALRDGGAVLQDAVHVVELPTHWDLAALHITPRRLAHKAGVHTYGGTGGSVHRWQTDRQTG